MNKITAPKPISSKKIRIRMMAVSILFIFGFLILGARAFTLHLTDNSKLKRLARTQYKRRVVVAPKRGNILDRNGETLAIDIKVDSVYATPHNISEPKKLVSDLSKALGVPKKKTQKKN